MSGSGPSTNDSQSKYTKPLVEHQEKETAQHNNTDAQFKKTHQVVGKPGLTDHNVMDDMIKDPPRNIAGDPTVGDGITGTGDKPVEQANTVEAKPVEEIRARIGDNANI